jgi:hypothetical protein
MKASTSSPMREVRWISASALYLRTSFYAAGMLQHAEIGLMYPAPIGAANSRKSAMTELTPAEFRSIYLNIPRPKLRPKICWYCVIDSNVYGGDRYVIRGFVPASRTGFPDNIYAERRFIKSVFDNGHPTEQASDFEWAIKSIEKRLYRLIDDYSEVAAP